MSNSLIVNITEATNAEPTFLIATIPGHIPGALAYVPDPDSGLRVLAGRPPLTADPNTSEKTTVATAASRQGRKAKLVESEMCAIRVPARVLRCIAFTTQRGVFLLARL